MILDIPVQLTVELGRTRIPIKHILQLAQGSVVELEAMKGEQIPLGGRIVAVADVFDALNSQRPYKKAWSLDDSRDYVVQNSGSHFDPRCVDAFVRGWDDVVEVRAQFPD